MGTSQRISGLRQGRLDCIPDDHPGWDRLLADIEAAPMAVTPEDEQAAEEALEGDRWEMQS